MDDVDKIKQLEYRADHAERGWWDEINAHNRTKAELRRVEALLPAECGCPDDWTDGGAYCDNCHQIRRR